MTEATSNLQVPSNTGPSAVHLPASRGRALTRAVAWAAPTLVLGAATVLIVGQIDFRPSAVAGYLVTYSLAIVGLVPAVAALVSAARTLQWLLFALWPGTVGVSASRDALILRLGTFGHRRYDATALDVRYPYELSSEETEDEFDAFLDEDEQRRRLVPRIAHAAGGGPLNRTILRFLAMHERDVAERMRPVVNVWRERRPASSKE